MTEHDLPEEILLQILSLCLLPPTHEFFQFPQLRNRARLSNSPQRYAYLLLVSKRWFRVGSPLLYSSLHLSTPSHAATVAQVLSSHPHIGRSVYNLRLDGGCIGDTVFSILRSAPEVERLYLTLDHRSGMRADALRVALTLVRPRELFIMDLARFICLFSSDPLYQTHHAGPGEALQVLEDVIANRWHDLVCTILPYVSGILMLTIDLVQKRVEFGPCFNVSASMSCKLQQAGVSVRML